MVRNIHVVHFQSTPTGCVQCCVLFVTWELSTVYQTSQIHSRAVTDNTVNEYAVASASNNNNNNNDNNNDTTIYKAP